MLNLKLLSSMTLLLHAELMSLTVHSTHLLSMQCAFHSLKGVVARQRHGDIVFVQIGDGIDANLRFQTPFVCCKILDAFY